MTDDLSPRQPRPPPRASGAVRGIIIGAIRSALDDVLRQLPPQGERIACLRQQLAEAEAAFDSYRTTSDDLHRYLVALEASDDVEQQGGVR